MVDGSFSSQFAYFKIRNDSVWFEALPTIYVKAKKTASDLSGSYEIQLPNVRGIANGYFTHFDNQELWFQHIPTGTMYRFMVGQINGLTPNKNSILEIQGRGLMGLFTDKKLNQSWTSKRGDFILCDPTFGAIPTNYPMMTTWNAFTNDFDRFDYWRTATWGAQPAWCDVIDGELEVTGNGSVRTTSGLTGYNFEVIEFRVKVNAAASSVKFGFTDGARGEYVQFALNAATVTCETKSGGTSTATATVSAITQTNYNYYRIEWDNADARFFVNGVLEQTIATNVPVGVIYPFFEMSSSSNVMTIDYMKTISLTKKYDSYVSSNKLFADVVSEICDIGNASTAFTYYVDDDWDYHAYISEAKSSGFSYGYNSALYNTKYQTVISLDLNDEAKDMFNFVRVTGGDKLTTVSAPTWTDQFLGDGATTTFALGYKAKKPLTLLQVDGVTKSEDTDFTVTYAKEGTVLKFATAPVAAKAINVRYDYYTPIIATATNNASVSLYGLTREYSKNDETITSDDRARSYANALLAYFSDPRVVIKIKIPLDPRLQVGTTVNVDAPYYAITNTVYEIIEMSCEMGRGTWSTELTLANNDISTSAEIIREILQQLKDLKTRGETSASAIVTDEHTLPEAMAGSELLEYYPRYVTDSFILESAADNGKPGRGVILEEWES